MRKWKEICLPFAVPWMDLEIIILSEVSQTGKDKYHMISLICEILENDLNELLNKTETDSQTQKKKLMVLPTDHRRNQKGNQNMHRNK